LRQLYFGQVLATHPVTDLIPVEEKRNAKIYQRYVNGEKATDLAKDYSVSIQRIYVLIRRYQQPE
jgi:Mor family transcriptional regulator